jgi:hypothetical protein
MINNIPNPIDVSVPGVARQDRYGERSYITGRVRTPGETFRATVVKPN